MVVTVTWRRAVAAIAILVALGIAVAWSGFINVAASTGHWGVTDWFLHWAMRNSVRAQAAMTVEPPATDPSGLISAAGHYAVSCAFCHGAPGVRPSPVAQAATPPPPGLPETVGTYTDEQLFWVIKHGVKFTSMPAWPAQDRDDEVRRMAAFVRRLPRMSAAEYRELAYGSERMGGIVLKSIEDALPDCERCHADDGRGQPEIPVLAGQKAAYLHVALEAYAAGRRSSGVMRTAAARVDRDVMRELAEHYASLPGLSEREAAAMTAALSEADLQAERIVMHGLPEADLPACAKCHAPGKRPHYPLLAGQKAEYMAARLRRWRGDENIVEARKPNESMPVIARRIPEHMIEPLARYYARLGAASSDRRAGVSEISAPVR